MTDPCPKCDNGVILKDNTRIFCECEEGRRKYHLWVDGTAQKAIRRARRGTYHDFKVEAAGDRERLLGEEG